MMQTGFYERKRMSPGAVAVVVLLHGAAITALVMAKEGAFTHDRLTHTTVVDVPLDKPPPTDPKPPKPHPQQPEALTRTDPLIKVVISDPLPPGPVLLDPPKLDPLPGPKAIDPPPTPAPPPPPPPAVRIEPARAKANLGTYVSDADYPSDAIRREEQGATRFKLAVGPDGRVSSCTVTASSGSAALDMATCRLMKSRARFAPARDTSGNPTTDMVSSSILWRLPNG
ncbi:MAG TPA: energy transducer TonB [Allosphingosinicella sp.]|jgi:protein TonB